MDWLDKFLNSPWFEKLFWLFFIAVPLFILYIFIKILIEWVRFSRPYPTGGVRAKSSGAGMGVAGTSAVSFDSSGASFEASTEAGSSDGGSGDSGGGGGQFSGGGGDYGGGGSSGGW